MIVDSPGVGESDDISEFVLNYLPSAFCFIYVINSVNAGGVHDDRVGADKVKSLQKKTQNTHTQTNKQTNCHY